ncbi:phosphatidate cytidylyltransferase [Candidatus Pelagibacter sp.]|jgi:phosphatidate cytidylyltransferase|nr:phosphatidate cytidylyltransferase [Candidatus Pelagibacter sp.]
MNSELKKRFFTSIALLSLLAGMYFYSFMMIISLIIIAIITWIEFYSLISKIFKKKSTHDKFFNLLYKSISLLCLFSLVYYIFLIESNYPHLKIYLIYSILVAVMSDIGGLVFGKTFKGRKLTKISPNKTISGSIGSFFFALFLIPIFYDSLFEHKFLIIVLITILISLTSQLGDIFISLIKRKAKVKNTSDLLPGHGGILDRVDGIIFSIPIGVVLFIFLI